MNSAVKGDGCGENGRNNGCCLVDTVGLVDPKKKRAFPWRFGLSDESRAAVSRQLYWYRVVK